MDAPPYTIHNTPQTLMHDRLGHAVELLFIHETEGVDPSDLSWLTGGPVSVNMYIGRSPARLVVITPPDANGNMQAAAHAGECTWGPHQNPAEEYDGWGIFNLISEGIEVSGKCDGTPFTPDQITLLLATIRWRMAVHNLAPDRVVRHRDLAWKPGRRSDPRGVDWDWLQEQISTTPNPLAGSSVGGASGPFSAPQLVADFYNVHGGLLTFGYATNNAYEAPDSSGEVCVYLPVEFGLIKYKPSAPAGWNVRLAPIAEVIAAQGGTHP